MCNPEQQAFERALNETDEEQITRVAQSLDHIPEERLISLTNGYMENE